MPNNGPQWKIDKTLDFTNFDTNPCQWFANQDQARGLTCFLAHADDGVIWGRVEDGKMKLAGEAFEEVKVELRAVTLQQARLFGEAGELLVWRTEEGFNGRLLTDNNVDPNDIVNETHWLWGEATDPPGPRHGFTLMRDGIQGLLHAPPLKLARNARAALKVRHYLDYDEQGQAYIALSRLVELTEIK